MQKKPPPHQKLSPPQPPLTKKRFEALIKKMAQPTSEAQCRREAKETSESHPSDGRIGKRKRRGKTGGKAD